MSTKPSYKLARDARDKKGDSTMEIEPKDSGSAVIDDTKPESHTESLVPPLKQGEHRMSISPNPNAGEGWSTEPAPKAYEGDSKRSGYTGTTKI